MVGVAIPLFIGVALLGLAICAQEPKDAPENIGLLKSLIILVAIILIILAIVRGVTG